jgi:hypothetical protein
MSSAVFEKKDDFIKMAEAFQTDTADLASAAQGADLNGIKGPFNDGRPKLQGLPQGLP